MADGKIQGVKHETLLQGTTATHALADVSTRRGHTATSAMMKVFSGESSSWLLFSKVPYALGSSWLSNQIYGGPLESLIRVPNKVDYNFYIKFVEPSAAVAFFFLCGDTKGSDTSFKI